MSPTRKFLNKIGVEAVICSFLAFMVKGVLYLVAPKTEFNVVMAILGMVAWVVIFAYLDTRAAQQAKKVDRGEQYKIQRSFWNTVLLESAICGFLAAGMKGVMLLVAPKQPFHALVAWGAMVALIVILATEKAQAAKKVDRGELLGGSDTRQ